MLVTVAAAAQARAQPQALCFSLLFSPQAQRQHRCLNHCWHECTTALLTAPCMLLNLTVLPAWAYVLNSVYVLGRKQLHHSRLVQIILLL